MASTPKKGDHSVKNADTGSRKKNHGEPGAKRVPLRMCVCCREMKPKLELVRVARNPENLVIIDKTGRTPGRGAYVCKNPICFAKAKKARMLERALNLPIPTEIFDEIYREISAPAATSQCKTNIITKLSEKNAEIPVETMSNS